MRSPKADTQPVRVAKIVENTAPIAISPKAVSPAPVYPTLSDLQNVGALQAEMPTQRAKEKAEIISAVTVQPSSVAKPGAITPPVISHNAADQADLDSQSNVKFGKLSPVGKPVSVGSGANAVEMQLDYGTSARNAHKVYFPRETLSAPGAASQSAAKAQLMDDAADAAEDQNAKQSKSVNPLFQSENGLTNPLFKEARGNENRAANAQRQRNNNSVDTVSPEFADLIP